MQGVRSPVTTANTGILSPDEVVTGSLTNASFAVLQAGIPSRFPVGENDQTRLWFFLNVS